MHSNYTDKKVKETKNCVFFSRKPTMQKCFIMPPDARLSAIHSENYTFYKVLLICLVYYFLAIILFSDHCLPCNGRLRVPGVGQRALELDTGAALGEHSQWPLHAETGHWGHDVNMMWQCDKLPSTVSCTNMLSFLLMLIWHSYRPLSLGLTELKKIMSEYFCSCPSGVTRQFSSKLSSLSKILPNIVLLSFVWTFCQCHTKPANSFFCGGIIFILIPTIFIVCEIFDKSRQLFISKIGFC